MITKLIFILFSLLLVVGCDKEEADPTDTDQLNTLDGKNSAFDLSANWLVKDVGPLELTIGEDITVIGEGFPTAIPVTIGGRVTQIVSQDSRKIVARIPPVSAGVHLLAVGNEGTGFSLNVLISGAITSEQFKACESDGQVDCVANVTFQAVDVNDLENRVLEGEIVGGVAGTFPAIGGSRTCDHDGDSECVALDRYVAMVRDGLVGSDIKIGHSIGGVEGTYGDTLENFPVCTSGGTDCQVVGQLKAVDVNEIGAKHILAGRNVAGIDGTLGNCIEGASGCIVSSGTNMAVSVSSLSGENIRQSVTIGGVTGSYGGGNPEACQQDGETGCITSLNFAPVSVHELDPDAIRATQAIGGREGRFTGGTGIVVTDPSAQTTISLGSTLDIKWQTYLFPGDDGVVDVFARRSPAGCNAAGILSWGNPINSSSYNLDTNGLTWAPGITGNWFVCVRFKSNNSDYQSYALSTEPIMVQPSGWHLPTHSWRRQFTIDGSFISSTLNNFPVLIKLTDPVDGKTIADGRDIRFTTSEGNELPHEIDTWTGTQKLVWVKLENFAPLNNVVYMYYGNPKSEIWQESGAVWTEYDAVFHMNLPVRDSKTQLGSISVGSLTQVSGSLGNAVQFDNSSVASLSYFCCDLDFANSTSTQVTITALAKTSVPSASSKIVEVRIASLGENIIRNRVEAAFNGSNSLRLAATLDDLITYSFNGYAYTPSGAFDHLMFTFLPGSPNSTFQISDGGGAPSSLLNPPNGTSFASGPPRSLAIGRGFTGALDEIRISSTPRTSDWITAEYNSMTGGITITPGPEEPN